MNLIQQGKCKRTYSPIAINDRIGKFNNVAEQKVKSVAFYVL